MGKIKTVTARELHAKDYAGDAVYQCLLICHHPR